MKPRLQRILLTGAAIVGLMSLALMVLTLVTTSPLILVVGMMIGQGLGTMAFLMYGTVVVVELWTTRLGTKEETPEGS
jgi:tellurite resistance protein TehA-like permease